MLKDIFEVSDEISQDQNKSDALIDRRNKLLALIEKEYSGKKGKVVLFAPFESDRHAFIQESSFFYFTGLSDPGLVMTSSALQGAVLYEPDFGGVREEWAQSVDVVNQDTISLFGINELKSLGQRVSGYAVGPYFSVEDYAYLIDDLRSMVAQQQYIFTLYPTHPTEYASVKFIIDRLQQFVPGLKDFVVDVSPLVAQLRRKKEIAEIENLYQAINITHAGFQAAARMLKPGITEAEVQAAIEYIFRENNSLPAYPSIVAGGKRSTILHYTLNDQTLGADDLLLIDAGAMYQHYCADIARTLPVSGKFNDRQQDIYKIVIEVQQYVAERARPGVWLSNVKEQENSLQHIALSYLKKKGYDSYFKHGIGHFLGLDVHDVGDRSIPLQEGDVITIEPGIYLPEESIGIRIEDNYWIVKDSEPVCLSESIPKAIKDVEEMVEESFDVDVI